MCDSVGESSLSAWKHGEELWPDVFDADATRAEKARVLDGLRAVRPVVETGYENTTLARALLERLPGYSIEEILNDWDGLSGHSWINGRSIERRWWRRSGGYVMIGY